ncbi:MAG: ABC transporter permease, partial [Bdellovibrionales bacterium]|nr:ABC transporter permease [Bdellovibrionales bacterium]
MWFLALRHLLSRKRQSVLIFLGITLGTTAFVAISGMMIGFQEYIVNQLVNNDAHIRISRREQRITEETVKPALFGDHELVRWQTPPSGRRDSPNIEHVGGWMERLDANPMVASYAPQLVRNGIVNRGDVSVSVRIIGTDPVLTLQEPTATEPVFVDADASGDGVTLSGLTLSTGWTTTEDWLLETDGQQWWVTGSRSGRQGETAAIGTPYRTENHELAFTLEGSASSGDAVTLSTLTGVVEHDLGAIPLCLTRVPGQPLALVGTWDDQAETGALVLWDLSAQAEVGRID